MVTIPVTTLILPMLTSSLSSLVTVSLNISPGTRLQCSSRRHQSSLELSTPIITTTLPQFNLKSLSTSEVVGEAGEGRHEVEMI